MEDVLAQFKTDGEILESDNDFLDTIVQKEQEADTEESPTETSETENSPSQEGETSQEEIPVEEEKSDRLDKNPRFKEVIEEKNFFKKQAEEQNARIAELTRLVETSTKVDTHVEIPDWFKGIYGDDVNAYQNYLMTERQSIIEQAKREIITDQQRQVAEQEARVQRWNDYSTNSMDSLQAEGKSFDRNELMAFMLKWQPTDAQGNFDFNKGYELMSMTKPATQEKSKARKAIADISQTTNNTSERKRDFAVPGQFRNVSPYDLARED